MSENRKQSTSSIINRHKENTEQLYELCRTGKGKDIQKAREKFTKSYNQMEERLAQDEQVIINKKNKKK